MADYFHIATGRLAASSSSKRCPAPDWLRVTREDYERIAAIPRAYRTVEDDQVVKATGSLRAAVDAELLQLAKATKQTQLAEQASAALALADADYQAAAAAVDAADSLAKVDAVTLAKVDAVTLGSR